MPAIAALTINDGTANQTYTPVAKSGNMVTFVDTSASSSAGQAKLMANFFPATGTSAVDRVKFDLVCPYEETIDGSPVVKHNSRAIVEIKLPTALPSGERVRVMNLLANALGIAGIQTCVTSPEAFY